MLVVTRNIAGAREQWLNDNSGPLVEDIAIFGSGFLKLDITSFPEYTALGPTTQALFSRPDVPAYELSFVRLSPLYVLHRLHH
jgi:hypothetical protein